MVSSPDKLTALQRAVLAAFFAREQSFFLTGGAALAGFHLGHRVTDDLDLFTLDADAFERARRIWDEVARELGASVQVRQATPEFRRLVLERGSEAVVVDSVLERVPQIHPVKPSIAGVLVDPADEILANKLTALVGRLEERDLVDVYFLEAAGHRVETMLGHALAKDGGCTPANLAWLLSQFPVPDTPHLPPGMTSDELTAFRDALVHRRRRAALPPNP